MLSHQKLPYVSDQYLGVNKAFISGLDPGSEIGAIIVHLNRPMVLLGPFGYYFVY